MLAQTHITVTPDPPPATVVGGAVTLTPQPPPQPSLVACTWYRAGEFEIFTHRPEGGATLSHGPGYTRRETGGPGCSLRLGGLRPSDSGPYTVLLGMPGNGHSISVHLAVLGECLRARENPGPAPFPDLERTQASCR